MTTRDRNSLSVVVGIFMLVVGISVGGANEAASAVGGVLTVICGALLSWIGSFPVYGFGKLVEKTGKLAE